MFATRFVVPALALAAITPAQHSTEADHARPAMDIVEVAAKAGVFDTLLAAAKAAGLVETLKGDGPFTVFAPTDDAFGKLPEGTVEKLLKNKEKLASILTYHVVPGVVPAKKLMHESWAQTAQGQSIRVETAGDRVTVDGARVVKADVAASNGTIHVIDSVLLPRPNLVEVAVEAGSFKTLVKAVKAAELAELLANGGPYTVFAPTDAAFAALPDGTIPALLKDKAKLKSVLTFHVVPGRVLAQDIPMAEGDMISVRPATVQGQKLDIRRTDAGVMVGNARVVRADVLAGNGVIHVIDQVLLPK